MDVREIDDAEVAAFKRQGWVVLRELIDPRDARSLLERAEELMGTGADGDHPSVSRGDGIWNAFHDVGRRHDPGFWSVATHPNLGRNAARLLGRDSPIRMISEQLAVKIPDRAGDEGEVAGSEETKWHQDWFGRGVDRTTCTTWIALCDIPPERGSMRFLDGSHRYGALGASVESAARVAGRERGDPSVTPAKQLPEMWPDLAECPLSPPLHLRPGDATVHSAFVVHSAPRNTTGEPRWVYLVGLFPGDAIFTGMPRSTFSRLVEPGHVIDHPRFPVIYQPAG